jgi:hypothetical protein
MVYNLIHFGQSSDYQYLKDNLGSNYMEMEWYDLDGLSIENDYFPLFSIKINKAVYNKKVVHYGIPKTNEDLRRDFYPVKSYPNFFEAIVKRSLPIAFKTNAMLFNLYCFKGCIFELVNDEPKILFMVGVKTSHLPNLSRETSPPDYTKYAIFVSSDFTKETKYKNVYKKVYDTLIVRHLEEGVELIVTKDIIKRYFKNTVTAPKFRNVLKFQEYLRSFNKKLIHGI